MEASSLSDFVTTPEATLLEAAKVIQSNASRTVIVVEDYETNKILGVLSEGDILRALVKGADVRSSIEEFINVSFSYLQERDYEKALVLFREHGFALLPVVDADMHLQSVITWLDCLNKLSSH